MTTTDPEPGADDPAEPPDTDGPQSEPTASDYGEPGLTQPDWITPPADEVAPPRQ